MNSNPASTIRNLFLAVLMALSASYSRAETIAVLNAQVADRRNHDNMGTQIIDSVVTVLRKFKRFNVVERAQLDSLLQEMRFQASGLVDDKSIVAVGKQSGAETVALITYSGAVVRDREFSQMSLNVGIKFVDVKTGTVGLSKQIRAGSGFQNSPDLLPSSLNDLEQKLERVLTVEFPNNGYVIKNISNSDFLVDLGRKDGIAAGDEFVIFTEGEDIVHPVTKKILKGEKIILAEGVISSASEDTSLLKISSQNSSSPITVGAKVEGKPKKKGFMESLKDFSTMR